MIVIDDGSTDNTLDVVKNWELQNSEDTFDLHYYYKENSGPAASRNMGFCHTNGEYIYFLDSDDYMYGSLIEEAVKAMESEKSDCVIFGFDFTKGRGDVGHYLPPSHLGAMESFLRGMLWGYTPSVLRRSELAELIGFWNESLFIAEDYEYLGRTLLGSVKTSVLQKTLFFVCRDNHSLGNTKDSKKGLSNRLAAESEIVRLLKKRKDIPASMQTAYASRLYKTAINMYAKNELDFANKLGLLAGEIDCGPYSILDRWKRIVWRQGKQMSLVWFYFVAAFTFFRKKVKKHAHIHIGN